MREFKRCWIKQNNFFFSHTLITTFYCLFFHSKCIAGFVRALGHRHTVESPREDGEERCSISLGTSLGHLE